jgi:hypothetical protein
MFYAYKENDLICGSDKKETVIKICKNLKITDYEITDYEKIIPKKKTLDELKAEKLSELTSLCHNFDNRLVNNDMFIISSLGFKVNADIRSQNNLKGLIAVNADTVNFVDYNNEVHELTPSDLNILLVECSKNGENLYKQKWAYAEKIKACKTITELEKITFDFVMLDFSKE